MDVCFNAEIEPKWKNYGWFKLNTAAISINNFTVGDRIQMISDDCKDCGWRTLCTLTKKRNTFLLDTLYQSRLQIVNSRNVSVCDVTANVDNQGRYAIDAISCTFNETIRGEDISIAWFVCIVGLLLLFFTHDLYLNIRSGWWAAQEDHAEFYFGNIPRHKTSRRLLSVSVFRGLCVCFMALANSNGGGLWLFLHSTWDGITVADVIFPAFLFCAGLSSQIALSHKGKSTDWWKFVSRLSYLSLIGVFVVNKGSDWRTIRVLGVLQRLALCQLIVYPLQVWKNVKQNELVHLRNQRRFSEEIVPDIDEYDVIDEEREVDEAEPVTEEPQQTKFDHYFGEWRFIYPVFIVSYTLAAIVYLLRFTPIDGCPLSYTGPGGLSHNGSYTNCTGGVYGLIDRFILRRHIYTNAPVKRVYDSLDIDPEGILGTFNAILNVASGVHAGQILRFYNRRMDQTARFILYGLFYIILGIGSHSFVPINKQLWSPSFSFVTIGVSFIIYIVIRWSVDRVSTNIKLRTLAYVGDNALIIYILQEAFAKRLPYEFVVGKSNVACTLLSLWTVLFSIALGFIFREYDVKFKL